MAVVADEGLGSGVLDAEGPGGLDKMMSTSLVLASSRSTRWKRMSLAFKEILA
jgi:hypothetical protein